MIRVRPDGSVTMPLDTFKALDYGTACKLLGLSPSRPRASATEVAHAGRSRPRRRRPARAKA